MDKGFIQDVVDLAVEILADLLTQTIEIAGVFGEPVSNKRQLDAYIQFKNMPPEQQNVVRQYLIGLHGEEEFNKWVNEFEGRLRRSELQRQPTYEEVFGETQPI